MTDVERIYLEFDRQRTEIESLKLSRKRLMIPLSILLFLQLVTLFVGFLP